MSGHDLSVGGDVDLAAERLREVGLDGGTEGICVDEERNHRDEEQQNDNDAEGDLE